MAEEHGVYIPIHLEIDEAIKERDALVKKLAKTKVDIKVNGDLLENAKENVKYYDAEIERLASKLGDIAKFDNDQNKWVALDPKNQGIVDAYYDALEQTGLWADEVSRLEKEHDKLADAEQQCKDQIESLNDKIGEQGNAFAQMGAKLTVGMQALKKTGNIFGAIGKRLAGLAKRILFFSVVTKFPFLYRDTESALVKTDTLPT